MALYIAGSLPCGCIMGSLDNGPLKVIEPCDEPAVLHEAAKLLDEKRRRDFLRDLGRNPPDRFDN